MIRPHSSQISIRLNNTKWLLHELRTASGVRTLVHPLPIFAASTNM